MWKPGQPVRLTFEGITLRNMGEEDVTDGLVALMTDREANAYVAIPPNLGRDDIVRHILGHDNRRGFFFGVYVDGRGDPIGYARVQIDRAGVATWTLVIGDRRYWRSGAAVVISYMLRKFLFEVVNVHKIAAKAYSDNKAVVAAMAKSDYTHEGTLREAEPDGHGGRRDVLLYGQLRGEWRDKPPRKTFTPPGSEGTTH